MQVQQTVERLSGNAQLNSSSQASGSEQVQQAGAASRCSKQVQQGRTTAILFQIAFAA
jgi:hypothetical protein